MCIQFLSRSKSEFFFNWILMKPLKKGRTYMYADKQNQNQKYFNNKQLNETTVVVLDVQHHHT